MQRQRHDVLMRDYLYKAMNKRSLSAAFTSVPSNIDTGYCYQVLFNADTSKFVAFCLDTVLRDYSSSQEKNRDQVITMFHVKALQYPGTYAFIIKGVKYQGHWFYEKSHATYFQPKSVMRDRETFFNTLQQWGFFKNKSAEPDPEFWETHLFDKIKDHSQNSEQSEGNDNDDEYAGLYRIVASQMQLSKILQNRQADSIISADKLLPAYERQKKLHPGGFTGYHFMNAKSVLIYPRERTVFLAPVLIVDSAGNKSLHYYVTLAHSNRVYEWKYFKPKPLPPTASHYGSDVVEQLENITRFNFSFYYLNDANFWNNYILKQENGAYVYLTQLE